MKSFYVWQVQKNLKELFNTIMMQFGLCCNSDNEDQKYVNSKMFSV